MGLRRTSWYSLGVVLALVCAMSRLGVAAEAPAALRTVADWNASVERRDSAAEQALFDDARDGRWDRNSLLSAVLVAGGHAEPGLARRYEALVDDWADEIEAWSAGKTSEERARIALRFLHQRVLTGNYDETASSVAGAIERGNYNCLSSTILFELLAARLGIETWAVEPPSHVFARARLDGRTFDIETTTPRIVLASEHAAVSQQREIGPIELVAIVFYNRGIDLLERGDFVGAVSANRAALRLDPAHRAARKNLIAVLNNWAVDLAGRGEFRPAAAVLTQGLNTLPGDGLLSANLLAVHRQWIDGLCDAGSFERAAQLLDEFAQERPGEPYYRAKRSELTGLVGLDAR
jgi:tetratricopeptide (TPR) repeat protein